jgi:GDPmannose 4,6-dehydratase
VQPGAVVLRIDPRYYRPTEVESLIGDATKARERLGWSPTVGFGDLVAEMVHDDLGQARRDELLKRRGFEVKDYKE